jgi:hypothetical protein
MFWHKKLLTIENFVEKMLGCWVTKSEAHSSASVPPWFWFVLVSSDVDAACHFAFKAGKFKFCVFFKSAKVLQKTSKKLKN